MPPEDLNTPAAAETTAPYWETPGMFPVLNDERAPFWNYVDLLLLIGLLAFSYLLLALAATAWLALHPKLHGDIMAVALPMQFGMYVLMYLSFWILFKLRYGRHVMPSLGWRKTELNFAALAVGGFVLAIGLGALLKLLHTPEVDLPFEKLAETPFSLFLLALTAVVVAPIFEEMLFRGFLQPLFSKTFGTAAGIGLTGVLFGSLHASEYKMQWQYVAAIGLVGVVLGIVRARANSIIPSAIMHGCFNAVSMSVLIYSKYFLHK